ncbi:MAG: lipase family protein [Candidatus Omnitrophica bacterium]|nr:lipase family protein [Candidatus Omnitrophota bacterium]
MSVIRVANQRLLALPVMRVAYSDRTAVTMAAMAKAAYKSGDDIRNEIAPFHFSLVDEFHEKDTDGYLARHNEKEMIVVAFRGTEISKKKQFEDVKTDLKARLKDIGSGAKVHTGFWDSYGLVAGKIEKHLADFPGYAIYITGHSLGGALAVVCARQLNDDNIAACYTFGSPRVGNLKFIDKVKVPIYRVVNADDGVPRIPPPGWGVQILLFLSAFLTFLPSNLYMALARYLNGIREYVHYGDERYLTACKDRDSNSSLTPDDNLERYPDYSDVCLVSNADISTRLSQRWRRFWQNWTAFLDDHNIARYYKKLEAYASQRN